MHNGVKWFLKGHSYFFIRLFRYVSHLISLPIIVNIEWLFFVKTQVHENKHATSKRIVPHCAAPFVFVRIRAQPTGNGFFRINLKWWKLNAPRFYSNQNFLSNGRALLKVMAVKLMQYMDGSFKLLTVYNYYIYCRL